MNNKYPPYVKYDPNKVENVETGISRQVLAHDSNLMIVKVWFDEDRGVLMIHRTGMDKSEEIPLNDEQPVFEQISKIINNLKKEITFKQ